MLSDKEKQEQARKKAARIDRMRKHFLMPYLAIKTGFRTRSIPLNLFIGISVACLTIKFLIIESDYTLEQYKLYRDLWPVIYFVFLNPLGSSFFFFILPFYLWGRSASQSAIEFCEFMAAKFDEIGLVSATGRRPKFLSDVEDRDGTRVMTFKANSVHFQRIIDNRSKLEQAFCSHIEDIETDTLKGTFAIRYASSPMPDEFAFQTTQLKNNGQDNFEFLVGRNRVSLLKGNLLESPHILISGATQGGKSSFLRQFLTSLLISNEQIEVIFIDLKNLIEGNTFAGISNVAIIGNEVEARKALDATVLEMERRSDIIGKSPYKNVADFNANASAKNKMTRLLIVVDEAASLFMAPMDGNQKAMEQARLSTSKLAAKGRAVGIHVILATQRADIATIDANIKTHFEARLTFRMADAGSSLASIGPVDTAKLKRTPGRAIWRPGGTSTSEVQTPYMMDEEALELLRPLREAKQEPKSEFFKNLFGRQVGVSHGNESENKKTQDQKSVVNAPLDSGEQNI